MAPSNSSDQIFRVAVRSNVGFADWRAGLTNRMNLCRTSITKPKKFLSPSLSEYYTTQMRRRAILAFVLPIIRKASLQLEAPVRPVSKVKGDLP